MRYKQQQTLVTLDAPIMIPWRADPQRVPWRGDGEASGLGLEAKRRQHSSPLTARPDSSIQCKCQDLRPGFAVQYAEPQSVQFVHSCSDLLFTECHGHHQQQCLQDAAAMQPESRFTLAYALRQSCGHAPLHESLQDQEKGKM